MTVARRPRVALFGLFGAGNIGNEASLAAGIAAVRRHRPGAEVVVVAADPRRVTAEHGVAAVPISLVDHIPGVAGLPGIVHLGVRLALEPTRIVRAYRFLRSVDLLVVPGTGILDDFGVRPHRMPYDLAVWSSIARLAGCPWTLIGVGAGPIHNPVSRRLMRRAARNARVVTYRDEGSRRFMAGLGVPASADAVQPDVVFALPRPPAAPAVSAPRRVIGLGVMAYYGWHSDPRAGAATFERYLAAMVALAMRLLAEGHDVRLLIGDMVDLVAAERISAAVEAASRPRAAARITCERIATYADVMVQAARTDVLVASRYHNVIAGLMARVPTISIGYADKNRAVMAEFGLQRYCHAIDHIDVDALVGHVDELLDAGPSLRERITATADDLARRVDERFAAALDAVSQHALSH